MACEHTSTNYIGGELDNCPANSHFGVPIHFKDPKWATDRASFLGLLRVLEKTFRVSRFFDKLRMRGRTNRLCGRLGVSGLTQEHLVIE